MSAELQRLAFRWLARTRTVPVADCVHFGAFHYGRGEFNPYENYVTALARGEPVEAVRERFVDFLRHYRPGDFGAALGVQLERAYGLWQYPWSWRRAKAAITRPGWHAEPADIPDLLTHFSPRGIPRARIEQEFDWLERAYQSVRDYGYQPAHFAGHIRARRLVAAEGGVRYLIYDGNHRLSALAAIGHPTVALSWVPLMTVREIAVARWPRVADGTYSMADARRILGAYFEGNRAPARAESAAPLLDP